MAKEKGFYKDIGLDVTLKGYKDNIDIEDDILNGISTYGISDSSIFLSYLKGKNIKLISSYFKRSAMVIVAQENIKEPIDLVGKKLMLKDKDIFKFGFKYMFEKEGIDLQKIDLIQDKDNSIDKFISKEVDAKISLIYDETYKLDQLDIKYNILDPSDYGVFSLNMELFTSQQEVLDHKDRVKSFREASIKGWEYALKHKDEAIDIILQKYNKNITKDRLKSEIVKIEKLILPFAYKVGSINRDFLKRMKLFFRREYDLPLNRSISNFIFDTLKYSGLTRLEKEYISNKKVIKVCTNPNWQPIEFVKDGQPYGISIDTVKIIANKLDIKLDFIKTDSWIESQEYLKEKKCDILPAAIKTTQRLKYANFTQPYLTYDLAIVTQSTKPFVRNLDNISDKIMSRKKGSGLIVKLKKIYPDLKIIETKGYKEAFQKVIDGDAYFTISTLPVLDYYKNRYNMKNLQIAGYTKMRYKLRIAVRDDDPILLSVISKILSIIPNETHNIIYDKWVKKEIVKETDYQLVGEIVLIAIILGLFFLYRNIELKKYTIKLEQQKELYNLVFENSSNGVLMLDVNTQKFIECNNSIVKILGFKSKNDIINMHPSQLSPKYQPDGRLSEEKSKEMIAKAIKNGSHSFEWKHLRADGDEFWAEIILTSILLDGKKVLHVVWKDINDRKQAKEELEQLNKTLETTIEQAVVEAKRKEKLLQDQSRLAQMGEMISMIAHQWRQPLGAISSSVIVIQSKISIGKFDLSKEQDRDKFLSLLNRKLNSINEYVQSLSETIDDFRNFFKPDKQKEDVNILVPIERALKIVENSMNTKGIVVKYNFNVECSIKIYKNEIMQVILNILKNAEDNFIERKIENPMIEIDLGYENNMCIIKIIDNGGGISNEILSNIFDPYFSTKDDKNGTGLGLYMSKIMIEEHHNGTLDVYNQNSGVCFKIELPK